LQGASTDARAQPHLSGLAVGVSTSQTLIFSGYHQKPCRRFRDSHPQDPSTWVSAVPLQDPPLTILTRYLTFVPAQALRDWRPARPLPQEEKVRARPSARQHQAWPKAYPHRARSRRQPQVSRSPSRLWQLCLGLRAHHQEDSYHQCRESTFQICIREHSF